MSTTLRRPGPLQELPLEHFLPPNPNLPLPYKSNKRPLSPGAPSLYSPAKRRILSEEGIFSPEKTYKSPLSASRHRLATPARFAQALAGPDSPAKKLDFGPAKNHGETSSLPRIVNMVVDSTPKRVASSSSLPSSSSLAPSPELRPISSAPPSSFPSSISDDTSEMEDYFCSTSHLPSPRPTPTSTVLPRELPSPPDPQSVHYPGFPIYRDPYIVISNLELDPQQAGEDKDERKENLPLRRKARKAVTAPSATESKSFLISPESWRREAERLGKAKSLSTTPRSTIGVERHRIVASLTPRSFSFEGDLAHSMQESTPIAREKERKELRGILEQEVDDIGDEYEEEL